MNTPPDACRTRPATPDSLAGCLYSATPTIEDLTAALAEFSQRVPSPDLPLRLTCCCGKDGCENLSSWLETKGRLETRLRLSAGTPKPLAAIHLTTLLTYNGFKRLAKRCCSATRLTCIDMRLVTSLLRTGVRITIMI